MAGRAHPLPPPTSRAGRPADARPADPIVAAVLARPHDGFTEVDDPPPAFTVLPTGTTTLICNVGAPFAGLPTAFVAGPALTATSVARRPGTVCVDVKLTPPAAFTVLGVPLHELAGTVADVADVAGPAGARLVERIRSTPSWDGRFAAIDAFLTARLRTGPPPSPAVTWAVAQIVAARGAVSVTALADRVGWSRKHLRTMFRRQVGLSPKAVARVVRFTHLLRQVTAGPVDWTRLAAAYGYADQAHLCRDVQRLAGTTPTRLAGLVDPDVEVPFVQGAARAGA